MKAFISNLRAGHYNKFLIALLGAVLTVIVQQYGDNPTVQTVVSLATALGVYAAPNKPKAVPTASM